TKVEMTHVPYKGSSQAAIGLLTGETQVLISSPAAVIGQVKEGRIRALAVCGATRSALLPDVPTLAEAGVQGYNASSWYGMLAPAATPRAAIARLSEESVKALAAPDLRERLLNQGIDPGKGGSEELAG